MLVDIMLTNGSLELHHVCRLGEVGEQQVSWRSNGRAASFRLIVVSGILFLTMESVDGQPIFARWRCAVSEVQSSWLSLRRMWNHSNQPWACAVRQHKLPPSTPE